MIRLVNYLINEKGVCRTALATPDQEQQVETWAEFHIFILYLNKCMVGTNIMTVEVEGPKWVDYSLVME